MSRVIGRFLPCFYLVAIVAIAQGPTPALAAEGTIPNDPHPPEELFLRISPVMSNRHHNQPEVVNGYVFLGGNAVHEIWDISNPYAPVRRSELFSPFRFGEAEAHQNSFARFPDGSLHAVTISGRGIDLWNITDASSPVLDYAMQLEGINYGDNTEAVWGLYWEGNYIYVGGTNTGLHIVDATDPASPVLVRRIATSAFGGVHAGALWAIGNLLVITTPKDSSAIVTMDISNPANPIVLDVEVNSDSSYIGGFYGGSAFLQSPFRTYDVTTNPADIRLIGSSQTVPSEYMSFGEGPTLYLGSLRTGAGGVSGIVKYDISNPSGLVMLGHVVGRPDPENDDQFSVPVGNLLVVSDDQTLYGSYIAVHDTNRDTRPPEVLYVNPIDGAIDQATTSRVGISFSDQIELTSVNASSLIVRPAGGGPALTGRWGQVQTTVTFWPDQPLDPGTTYEVVLPAGGITDLVGNAIAGEFRSSFRTAGTP